MRIRRMGVALGGGYLVLAVAGIPAAWAVTPVPAPVFPAAAARTGRVQRLSFVAGVIRALKGSPAAARAAARVREAQSAITQIRGYRLPRLVAGVTGMRTNNALNVFGSKLQQRRASFNDFGFAEFNPNNPAIEPRALNYPGVYDNFNTRLTLQIPLWEGGRLTAMAAAARDGLAAARAGDRAARQQLIFRLLQAYEGVRAARAFVRVAIQGEKAAAAYAGISRQMYARGIVVKSNLLTAQVHLGDARLRVAAARNAAARALEVFHIVMGEPADARLDVGAEFLPPMPRISLTELHREALAANPAFRAIQARRAMRAAGVSQAGAAYWPRINLALMANWNRETPGLGARSYTAVANLSWQLFDLGARRGAVGRALAVEDQARAEQRAFRERLIHRLDNAYRNAFLAQQQITVRTLAVRQAGEAERILAARYGRGITTLATLLAGQARLDKVRADLVQAHYRLAVARAAIWLSIGRLNLAQVQHWAGISSKGEQ